MEKWIAASSGTEVWHLMVLQASTTRRTAKIKNAFCGTDTTGGHLQVIKKLRVFVETTRE